jgi:hypothetical protein
MLRIFRALNDLLTCNRKWSVQFLSDASPAWRDRDLPMPGPDANSTAVNDKDEDADRRHVPSALVNLDPVQSGQVMASIS